MASGIITAGSFPNPLPLGLVSVLEAQGIAVIFGPDGLHVSDVATVTATIASYVGSASELSFHKSQQQSALDDFFNTHFDLAAFIRGGTTTPVTAAQVGTFLATIASNYRLLRANIAAAATVAAVNAINVQGGWPSNP